MVAAMLGLIGCSLCFLVYFMVALLREQRTFLTGYWLQVERNTQAATHGEYTSTARRNRALARAA